MTVRAVFLSLTIVVMPLAVRAQPAERQSTTPPTTVPRTLPTPVVAPPAGAAPEPRAAAREGQPLNVKVELTITDQRGGNPIFKKTVTVVTADGMGGFIRSTARYQSIGDVPLNVDTQPRLLSDGKIRVNVNLQYDLPAIVDSADTRSEERRAGPLTKTSIHENLSLVLENGKSIVAAQSADPVGDRQVLIEVKATVLR